MSEVRLAWHVIVGPVAGAILGASAYALWLRPLLPWPAWTLDLAAAVCGTIGLLAGGVLLFRITPSRVHTGEPTSAPERRLRSPARAFGLSAGALIVAIVLAGVPVLTWPAVAAVIACSVVAAGVLRGRV